MIAFNLNLNVFFNNFVGRNFYKHRKFLFKYFSTDQPTHVCIISNFFVKKGKNNLKRTISPTDTSCLNLLTSHKLFNLHENQWNSNFISFHGFAWLKKLAWHNSLPLWQSFESRSCFTDYNQHEKFRFNEVSFTDSFYRCGM